MKLCNQLLFLKTKQILVKFAQPLLNNINLIKDSFSYIIT